MKYALLFCFFLLSIGKTNAQIVANGNSGASTTAYTNGTPNDPIYIWCATGLTNNTASLTANSPSGAGTYTYNWFYHNELTSSWTAYTTQTGTTSTISNLPSDGYRVQIYNSSNVLVGCYVAWVWNMNGQVSPTSTPTACNATNLTGNVGVNGSFSYYNPPLAQSIITATTQISVCFTATHTYVSDLAFYLVGPASCGSPTILLSPNPGAIGQSSICNSGDNVNNLCFSNTATANLNVCTATAPLTGSYRSYGPNSTLINWAPLYGCNAAQGGWTVRIYDCIGADVGALRNATITFSNLTPTCGAGTTVTYSSGTINSPINDNSCSPTTASNFQVPASPVLTNPITINATTALQWTSNPAVTIPNATSANTSVTNLPVGNYNFNLNATVSYANASCSYNGSTSFLSANITTAQPNNLLICGTAPQNFNLTQNTPVVNPLGTYQVSYHTTLANAQNNTAAIATPTAYSSNGNGQIIYVRTQSSAVCYDVKSFTLNITATANPTFNAVAPICSGATLAPLPTTSNNGFTGTWSPALNNTQTTTYTFTPNAGQCATTTTLQIVVNPNVTPTFNAVAPICSGGNLNPLPTTSNNGFTGTWSPALNNAQTTTYTFTPNAGQCATTATLQIVVNPNVTPTFTAVPPICSGGNLAPLPTTSNNGITGTWSPALNNTQTTTYTFTPNAGQCATTTTLQIVVNPNVTPTFTAVAPICSGGNLAPLPTTSNNGITGTWSPALNNTQTTTYTFTPNAGQCATTTTLQIVVNPNITPTFTAVAPICSGGNLAALPTTSNNGYAGTWSPALNNTQTTTYTFTPNSGQCATTTTLEIVVNPNITPTFTAVAPICEGGNLNPLPTMSNNGITGTWSPALDNTQTTTYTFTPNSGTCVTTATLEIVVNPNITPTFDAVAPICSGGNLTALPTTSNNGITGTWSPALDNTQTTTYTFTPDSGQCATTATLEIIVNSNITPTFDTVAPICEGGNLDPLPTFSNNGFTGIWSPALNNTQTTTYTFTPDSGQCATTTTLEIVVNPNITPTFDAVAPICEGATLAPLPTTSNNGYTGVWSPASDNTQTTTYTFTPDSGQCATTVTLEIIVNPHPDTVAPTPLEVCDDNNDGFATFNLTVKTNEITNSNNALTVTYHETEINAQNGVGAINPATAYQNINQNTQTIYVRIVNTITPDCVNFETLQLIVNPVPNVISVADYVLCDVNNPNDGIEEFDLSTKTTEILNGQTNVSVTFYLNQAAAQAGTAGTEIGPLYQNTVSNPQIVWFRIENNSTNCFSVGSFRLVVNPTPVITTPTALVGCSGAVNGQAQFDLTVKNQQILNGQTGMIVTYHTTLQGANTQTALIDPATNFTGIDGQIIYVRVQNIDTGCFTTTQFELDVINGPGTITPTPLTYCDPNNDGFGTFDLSLASAQILAGTSNMTITYHETIQDATFGTNQVGPIYNNINQWTQIIYVRLQSTIASCSYIVPLQLIVNPTPQAITPTPIGVCDNNADGFASFNITILESQILNGANPQAHTITYHLTQANANADTNAITNVLAFTNTVQNSQTIYVRVEVNATGCCTVVPLQLIVNPLPVVAFPVAPYEICDINNSGDEFEVFDLASYIPTVTTVPGMNVTFHFNEADAIAATPTLPLQYTNQIAGVQTIFVRVTNADTQCFAITLLDLRVEPLPAPVIPEPTVECDADGDGFALFNLQELIPEILNGAPNTQITFHETFTNADLGLFPLGNTYQNVNAFLQTIYIRAVNTQTGCYSVVPMELKVNASPTMPVLSNLQICDNNQDGIHTIDLTQQSPLILNAQTGGSTYIIKYFTSLAAAQSGLSAIVTPANYLGTNGQTIWVSITDTVSGCFAIGSFQLQIDTPLALNPAYVLSICDNLAPENDSVGTFDLTSMNSVITGNASGYTVQYYLSLANAQSNTSPILTPESFSNAGLNNPYTLYVAVTNVATTCRSYTSLTIRVLPVPTPRTDPQDLISCDNVNSPNGTEIFNLTTNENYIRNNNPALTFAYYPTEADAIAQTNQITTPTAYEGVGTIFIRVMNSQTDSNGNRCYVLVAQELIVNPLPIVATTPVINAVCQQNNTGFATFTLSDSNEDVLDDTQNTSDFTFSYYFTLANAQSGTNPLNNLYVNVTNPQDIYVRVVNNLTGCVNATAVVTLIADDGAIANPVDPSDPDIAAIITTCDDDGNNDGFYVFNLSDLDETILGTQITDPDYTVHYYTDDALIALDMANGGPATTNDSAIQNPGTFTNTVAFGQTIYAVVINRGSVTGCPSIVSFPITVNPLPEPVIDNDGGIICVDFDTRDVITPIVLSTQFTSATHTFEWSLGGSVVSTDETFTVDTMPNATAIYSVVVTDIATGCSSESVQTTITRSGPPVIVNVLVTNAFTQNQVITVVANGFGTYEYQLDNGAWQSSNVFSGVSIGEHTVSVRDILLEAGCGSDSQTAMAIGFPNYFTPNGDGINDTWNIVGLDATAQIYIFDRYGKLVKQISGIGEGWDGTMNGQHLPSTDYWFKVIYIEQLKVKEFRAHFSLKR